MRGLIVPENETLQFLQVKKSVPEDEMFKDMFDQMEYHDLLPVYSI